MSEILNDEGYEVHLAENASKAKKIQKENKKTIGAKVIIKVPMEENEKS